MAKSEAPNMPSDSSQPSDSTQKSPFMVVGIALIVDHIGKGARLVLRYPTAPVSEGVEDLFMSLPSRQMAKLFRPKPALCGQPMTLSIGGTVFCCRATLMAEESEQQVNDEAKDHLSLFSIVVALAPHVRSGPIPISGWVENVQKQSLSIVEGKLGAPSGQGTPSASFLSIRRVHISLARLCRILEREERRCRYVSIQSEYFRRVRGNVQKSWQESQFKAPPVTKAPTSAASPISLSGKSASTERKSNKHRRVSSFSMASMGSLAEVNNDRPKTNAATDDPPDELEQDVLEILMASGPPDEASDGSNRQHNGNLARELVQVFHALARTDHDFPPSPSDLLTNQAGIVYINRHLAVAIEALSPRPGAPDPDAPTVRPYQTLLFPQASPSQLLERLKAAGSAATRRLQQLLLMVSPQKSLKEAAVDANLPLQTTLEIAAYLVSQGTCLASPVLARSSRLACLSIETVQDVSLAFGQTFGPTVHPFVLVSFVTQSGRTLGDSITALTTSTDAVAVLLRGQLEACLHSRAPTSLAGKSPTNLYAEASMAATQADELRRVEELEELFFQMVTWLCSRSVMAHLLDFLVAVQIPGLGPSRDGNDPGRSEKKSDTVSRLDAGNDEVLFHELQDLGCLEGRSSLACCCWRSGVDMVRLRAFAARHDRVRVVSRVAAPGDEL